MKSTTAQHSESYEFVYTMLQKPSMQLATLLVIILAVVVVQVMAYMASPEKFKRSWTMLGQCFRVLMLDKELLVFPLLSMVATGFVSALTMVSLWTHAGQGTLAGKSTNADTFSSFGNFAVVYFYLFSLYFITIYCNTALVGALRIRLRGGNPGLGDGFVVAFTRLPQIIGYALIASTVGILLSWIGRQGKVAAFVADLLGFAWNLLVYLVVPVLAYEGVGPLQAIRRSGELLKKTWGEQIVGTAAIGGLMLTASMICCFVLVLVFGGAAYLAGSFALVLFTAIALFAVILFFILLNSTVHVTYTTLLYSYATGRTNYVRYGFRKEILRDAFSTES